MLAASCGHESLQMVQEDRTRCRFPRLSCRRYSLQQEAVRKPRRQRTWKHRVALRVRASRAVWSRDGAFLTGLPIATAGRSGETPAHPPRGPLRMHKALPSLARSSQMSFENVSCPAKSYPVKSCPAKSCPPRQVVCLIEAKWVFAQDHSLPILFRKTREPEMLVRSNSECAES